MRRKMDLSDWERFSIRCYTESYCSKDGKWLMKVANADHAEAVQFEEEQCMGVIASKMGLPVPEVGELVDLPNNSIGLTFEYLKNKKSFSRAVSEHPENYVEYMQRFADVARRFHSVEVEPGILPPVKDRMYKGLDITPVFNEKEKDYLRGLIDAMPVMNRCVHGDFQFSNAVMCDRGNFIIDIGLLACGHPYCDLGFLYHMVHFADDALMNELFHIDKAMGLKCWEVFIKSYFGMDDMDAIEKELGVFRKLGILAVLVTVPDAQTLRASKSFLLEDMK